MNAIDKFLFLPDTQALPDLRRMPIQKVGIRGLRYPMAVKDGGAEAQNVLATLEMTVGLPHDVKGTHMSRFVEVLEGQRAPLDLEGFRALFATMLDRLDATTGHLTMRFTYFIRKAAPVSGTESLLDYDATWEAACDAPGDVRVAVSVTAPVTSLCPCSKKISDYGAHNQRSLITIRGDAVQPITLEEMARLAEDEASCEVWGLLKRPDEKWVTERAYDNPKFVEDLVRDIALRLAADPRIGAFRVASENFESIHNHSAYAEIEGRGAARAAARA
ncbi:MAG: GTP cyclohydrolase FolE2 [Betaproteobacteria bacterium]|jgi:GTP cyclohydrolase I|nr:GTP cyclohydrolase FolE2 [Betaproteobacteria bacterium]